MLDVAPSEDAIRINGRHGRRHHGSRGADGGNEGLGGNHTSALEQGLSGVAQRFRRTQQRAQEHFPLGRAHSATTNTPELGNVMNNGHRITFADLPRPGQPSSQEPMLSGPTPPLPVASPINRADTTSAASTVYVVRYDTVAGTPQPARRRADRDVNGNTAQGQAGLLARRRSAQGEASRQEADAADEPQRNRNRNQPNMWHAVSNPFKRKRASPPAEVQQARQAATSASAARAATPVHNFSRWDVKNRLGVLAAETGERIRDRQAGKQQDIDDLPLTIIPAQPRGSGRTWSPEVSSHQQAAAQTSVGAERNARSNEAHSNGSTTLTGSSGPESSASASRRLARPPRADDISPRGAGGTITPTVIPAPSRNSQPPRADDISPVAGTSAVSVIPAPRRSPLHSSTPVHGEAAAPGPARRPSDNG